MRPAYSARRRDHGIRNPERADGSRTEQRLQPTPRGVLQGAARLNLTFGGRDEYNGLVSGERLPMGAGQVANHAARVLGSPPGSWDPESGTC